MEAGRFLEAAAMETLSQTPASGPPPVEGQIGAGVSEEARQEAGGGWFYLDPEAQSQGPYNLSQLIGKFTISVRKSGFLSVIHNL